MTRRQTARLSDFIAALLLGSAATIVLMPIAAGLARIDTGQVVLR